MSAGGSFVFLIGQITGILPAILPELLVTLGMMGLFLFVLVFNASHQNRWARIYLCLDLTFVIVMLDLGYGGVSSVKNLLLGAVLLPSFLFDKLPSRIGFTLVPAAGFFLAHFLNPLLPDFLLFVQATPQEIEVFFVLNHSLLIVMMVVLFNQFRGDLDEYQVIIEEKNQHLEEASEEIRAQRDDLVEANQEIQTKNEEIMAQRDMLEQTTRSLLETNQNLTDSINYAKRIQDGLAPNPDLMARQLQDFFVFLRPKDVVSGDAVYYRDLGDYYVLASVDCTGHGVPGSLMTMMMYTIMDQIVVDLKVEEPYQILDRLNEGIRRALANAEDNQTDGMDMGVIVGHKDSNLLKYSGAKHPLFVWNEQEGLHEIAPTSRPIGAPMYGDSHFEQHTITLVPNTRVYLFSDGYADQFGGPKDRKFMKKRFRKLMAELASLPMAEQAIQLQDTLNAWTQFEHHPQVDDILVIGVKVS